MSEELMPWHQTWLVGIEYNRVDLVKEGANSPAKIKLIKSKGGIAVDLQEILKAMKPEHAAVVQKALDEAAKAVTDAQAQAAEAVAKAKPVVDPGQSEEEILKSVADPAVKALLEKSFARAAAAEAVVKEATEKAEKAEAIAKAKEVPAIGAEEAKLAEVYKKLKSVDAGLCDDVFGIFKSANALISSGEIFKEAGGSGGDGANAVPGNEQEAWAAIEKAAEVHIAKGMKNAEAITKAIEENPKLYSAYIKAQRGI